MKKIVSNRRAFYEYEILEEYTCGIKLQGSEVKSIKNNKISITEAYCFIDDKNEVYLKGANVTPHEQGGKHYNHVPVRDRKLLMKKKEIIKLKEKIGEKGLTLVPLSVIISDTGFIKVEIGLGKGKKLYQKKESIKVKDIERDIKRELNK